MIVYCISPDGYFTGKTVDAPQSPFRPGEYLMPAFTVAEVPPILSEEQRARWTGNEWVIETDVIEHEPFTTYSEPEKVLTLQQQQAAWFLDLAEKHISEAIEQGLEIPDTWLEYRDTLSHIAADATGLVRLIPNQPDPIRPPLEEAEREELPLEEARAHALTYFASILDIAVDQITGPAPFAEKLAWSPKSVAAIAYKDGIASKDQLAMLQAEAIETGETLDELTDVILNTASVYNPISGTITGIRRVFISKFNECRTLEEVREVMAQAKKRIDELVTQ